MRRDIEISILKDRMRQLDEKRNVDAGVMHRNPTDVYPSREIVEREKQAFFGITRS